MGRARRASSRRPAPLYEPEGAAPTTGASARALHAAGFRRGDLVHNAFAYHMTPAGSMLESGAHALGCTVFPGGTGQTEQQVQALADLRPDGYVGTPSFLKILLDKADELGVRVDACRRRLVSGEAFPAALRDAFARARLAAYQLYATADLGSIAYETEAREGLVSTKACWSRSCGRAPAIPVPAGEVGEVVVTPLFNADYPLVRFAHRRPVGAAAGRVAVRAHERAPAWLARPRRPDHEGQGHVRASRAGRAGDRAAIPACGAPGWWSTIPAASTRMTLEVEGAETGAARRGDRRDAARRDEAARRGALVAPGTLPNDGKVIDDRRKID